MCIRDSFVLPDDLARRAIVFTNDAVPFVADEVIAAVELAGEARVGVWMRMVDLELDFPLELPFAIHFDDATRAALGNHHDSTGQGLELSLIHISEPTRLLSISYAVF